MMGLGIGKKHFIIKNLLSTKHQLAVKFDSLSLVHFNLVKNAFLFAKLMQQTLDYGANKILHQSFKTFKYFPANPITF